MTCTILVCNQNDIVVFAQPGNSLIVHLPGNILVSHNILQTRYTVLTLEEVVFEEEEEEEGV